MYKRAINDMTILKYAYMVLGCFFFLNSIVCILGIVEDFLNEGSATTSLERSSKIAFYIAAAIISFITLKLSQGSFELYRLMKESIRRIQEGDIIRKTFRVIKKESNLNKQIWIEKFTIYVEDSHDWSGTLLGC